MESKRRRPTEAELAILRVLWDGKAQTVRAIQQELNASRQTQRQLLGDLMNRAFGGSVKALVLQALAAKKSSPEELEAMEKLLDRIEGGKK